MKAPLPMTPGKFDVAKARKLADRMLEYPDEIGSEQRRLAMTLRAACNEIEAMRERQGRVVAEPWTECESCRGTGVMDAGFGRVTCGCVVLRINDRIRIATEPKA